jgi:SAM-dependent methyltransferase
MTIKQSKYLRLINFLKKKYFKEMYQPSWLGIILNPFYIVRNGLNQNIKYLSKNLKGNLLDIGCGSKPYEDFFKVKKYIGLDIESKKSKNKKKADFFYDGRKFPFKSASFDCAICSEVIEHVFDPDYFLKETNRVLKKNGRLLISAPFIWDEHEQPFDYARYSSFGLRHLLKKNNFTIILEKKNGTDVSAIFQLINCYIYKIIEKYPKFLRLIIFFLIMGSLNILGLLLGKTLPKNKDFYLGNIFLVKKR